MNPNLLYYYRKTIEDLDKRKSEDYAKYTFSLESRGELADLHAVRVIDPHRALGKVLYVLYRENDADSSGESSRHE
jgi:hypothetical protein